ncbi:MAG TPA: hypothetical protein VKO38_07440 [Wenzhouxiangella sp.]|nr:hypothetical protein [Wenzhouxiangella sp.]
MKLFASVTGAVVIVSFRRRRTPLAFGLALGGLARHVGLDPCLGLSEGTLLLGLGTERLLFGFALFAGLFFLARIFFVLALAPFGFFALETLGLLALFPSLFKRFGRRFAFGIALLLLRNRATLDVGSFLTNFNVDGSGGRRAAASGPPGSRGWNLEFATVLRFKVTLRGPPEDSSSLPCAVRRCVSSFFLSSLVTAAEGSSALMPASLSWTIRRSTATPNTSASCVTVT